MFRLIANPLSDCKSGLQSIQTAPQKHLISWQHNDLCCYVFRLSLCLVMQTESVAAIGCAGWLEPYSVVVSKMDQKGPKGTIFQWGRTTEAPWRAALYLFPGFFFYCCCRFFCQPVSSLSFQWPFSVVCLSRGSLSPTGFIVSPEQTRNYEPARLLHNAYIRGRRSSQIH